MVDFFIALCNILKFWPNSSPYTELPIIYYMDIYVHVYNVHVQGS